MARRERPTSKPTAGVWFAQPERPLVAIHWKQTGPYSYEAEYGRWRLTMVHNVASSLWFALIFDTRAFQTAAALQDEDQNALRAQMSATMSELVILEGN